MICAVATTAKCRGVKCFLAAPVKLRVEICHLLSTLFVIGVCPAAQWRSPLAKMRQNSVKGHPWGAISAIAPRFSAQCRKLSPQFESNVA
jgi:hypothetical protein